MSLIGNPMLIPSRQRQLKQKVTNLIPTHHRVVPLEHYFYQENEIVKIFRVLFITVFKLVTHTTS